MIIERSTGKKKVRPQWKDLKPGDMCFINNNLYLKLNYEEKDNCFAFYCDSVTFLNPFHSVYPVTKIVAHTEE